MFKNGVLFEGPWNKVWDQESGFHKGQGIESDSPAIVPIQH